MRMLPRIGRNLKSYQTKLMLAQPFGIYVSKGFIAQHPGVLGKVNAAIRKVIPQRVISVRDRAV